MKFDIQKISRVDTDHIPKLRYDGIIASGARNKNCVFFFAISREKV